VAIKSIFFDGYVLKIFCVGRRIRTDGPPKDDLRSEEPPREAATARMASHAAMCGPVGLRETRSRRLSIYLTPCAAQRVNLTYQSMLAQQPQISYALPCLSQSPRFWKMMCLLIMLFFQASGTDL